MRTALKPPGFAGIDRKKLIGPACLPHRDPIESISAALKITWIAIYSVFVVFRDFGQFVTSSVFESFAAIHVTIGIVELLQ